MAGRSSRADQYAASRRRARSRESRSTPFLQALKEGLRNHGYAEGKDLILELRSAGGDASALPDSTAELIRRNVNLIVAYQTSPAVAAKNHLAGTLWIFSSSPSGDVWLVCNRHSAPFTVATPIVC
jgi:hypothetical protein